MTRVVLVFASLVVSLAIQLGSPSLVSAQRVALPQVIQRAVAEHRDLFSILVEDDNSSDWYTQLQIAPSVTVLGWKASESSRYRGSTEFRLRRSREVVGFRFAEARHSQESTTQLQKESDDVARWMIQPTTKDGVLTAWRLAQFGGGWVGDRKYEHYLSAGGRESDPGLLITEKGEIAGIGLCVKRGKESHVIRHSVPELVRAAGRLYSVDTTSEIFDVHAARAFCAPNQAERLEQLSKALPIAAESHKWSFVVLSQVIWTLEERKSRQYALRTIEKLKDGGLPDPILRHLKSELLIRDGRIAESMKIIQSLLLDPEMSWWARVSLLKVSVKRAETLALPVGVYPLPKHHPTPIEAAEFGLQLIRFGNYDDAISFIRPVTKSRYAAQKYVEALARALLDKGFIDQAIQELMRIVHSHQARESSRLLLADAYKKLGIANLTRRQAEYVNTIIHGKFDSLSVSQRVNILSFRASVRLKLDEIDEARADAEHALRLDEKALDAAVVLCKISIRDRDREGYEELLARVKSQDPKSAVALEELWKSRSQ